MGEIPAANLSSNFVEPDPSANCQLTDNPVTTSHSATSLHFKPVPQLRQSAKYKAFHFEKGERTLPFILTHIQVQSFQGSEAADGGALVIGVDVRAVLAAPTRVPLDTGDHS